MLVTGMINIGPKEKKKRSVCMIEAKNNNLARVADTLAPRDACLLYTSDAADE